jgi:hypothetical protein
MRIGTFLKGALVGGVGACAVMGATAALAGTGVGGIFNLGQTNTVSRVSTLTGSEAGPGLQVTNNGTGTGATALSLTAAPGKPPLTVNNNTLVARLNANLLQSYGAASLNRVGASSNETLFGIVATETDGTVKITAPVKGFVKVEGTFEASMCSCRQPAAIA